MTPIDEGEPWVETYSEERSHWRDTILVFPQDSGVPPLYVVYTTKSNVKPLEVGTYGELAPKSVKDGMDIDHIPSQAALIRAAETMTGRQLTNEEKKKIITY